MNSEATWARMICNNLNSYRALNSTETWLHHSRAVGSRLTMRYQGSALAPVSSCNSRHTFGAHRNQSPRLGKHELRMRRRDLLAKEAQPLTLTMIPIGPLGKFLGRRRVTDVGSTSPHDEAEHHFRFPAFCVARFRHQTTL